MNMYYLGPPGSYSEIIAKKMFATDKYTLIPVDGFDDIVERVCHDGRGILGIENSISSSVHESIDALFQSEVYIIAEASMKIKLYLGGMEHASLTHITDVFSHSQALAQCSTFIKKNNLKIHKTSSTAAAIDKVLSAHDVSYGAIGGNSSIKEKGLSIIAENIGNSKHNMTRWVIISQNPKPLFPSINKATYLFRIKHKPGSLVAVLKSIADVKGNMTKIESRPVPGSDWEYAFWIDVEIPKGSLHAIDTAIAKESLTYRRIGAYQKGRLYTE